METDSDGASWSVRMAEGNTVSRRSHHSGKRLVELQLTRSHGQNESDELREHAADLVDVFDGLGVEAAAVVGRRTLEKGVAAPCSLHRLVGVVVAIRHAALVLETPSDPAATAAAEVILGACASAASDRVDVVARPGVHSGHVSEVAAPAPRLATAAWLLYRDDAGWGGRVRLEGGRGGGRRRSGE